MVKMELLQDNDVALRLLREGAILVSMGAPRGTYFGVDMKCWRVDSEFRGVKMIPPGLHFVHYAASDLESGDPSPRCGFMHHFKSKEVLVKEWDKEKEDFAIRLADEDTLERFRANIHNLDKFLAPYPYDVLKKWTNLTSHITEAVVKKCTPESGSIRSALDLQSCNDEDRPRGNKTITIDKTETLPSTSESETDTTSKIESPVDAEKQKRPRFLSKEEKEEKLLPNLKPMPGTSLRFTEFPDRYYPENATPSEITKHHLDQSYVLETMMRSYDKPMDLIGEMEFAYVCFLIGHSLDAFEHWKKLVSLFCSCEDAIFKQRNVYMHFITVLQEQLMEIPEEFLADIVMNQNVIYVRLRNFFKTAYDAKIESRLKTAIERFQFSLTEKFMWNFSNLDNDEDDELPVIVHL